MLLKILDILACPACNAASRHWTLEGEVTDSRITNGVVSCPNQHKWNVTEEILRFDKEEADEPMQFVDHPRTGLPPKKFVEEQERFDFLDAFQEIVEGFEFSEEDITKITGDPILFMKYLESEKGHFVVCHPEEGILRQMQEIAVRKRMYDRTTFVRTDDVGYIGDIRSIALFDSAKNSKVTIDLKMDADRDAKWEGKLSKLVYEE